MDIQDFFHRRLPKIYAHLNVEGYPLDDLSVESLKAFKLDVDALWLNRLVAFQKARDVWHKANLELLRLESAKSPKEEIIEEKKLEVAELRNGFDSTFAVMMDGRRAEEITRVLHAIYADDEATTRWFEIQLSRVESYTPGLPA